MTNKKSQALASPRDAAARAEQAAARRKTPKSPCSSPAEAVLILAGAQTLSSRPTSEPAAALRNVSLDDHTVSAILSRGVDMLRV